MSYISLEVLCSGVLSTVTRDTVPNLYVFMNLWGAKGKGHMNSDTQILKFS